MQLHNISTMSLFFCHKYVSYLKSAVMLIFLAYIFLCVFLYISMKQFATRCHVQIKLAVEKIKIAAV